MTLHIWWRKKIKFSPQTLRVDSTRMNLHAHWYFTNENAVICIIVKQIINFGCHYRYWLILVWIYSDLWFWYYERKFEERVELYPSRTCLSCLRRTLFDCTAHVSLSLSVLASLVSLITRVEACSGKIIIYMGGLETQGHSLTWQLRIIQSFSKDGVRELQTMNFCNVMVATCRLIKARVNNTM